MRTAWHVLALLSAVSGMAAEASAQARAELAAPRPPFMLREEGSGSELDVPRAAAPSRVLSDFRIELAAGTLFPVSVGASARLVHDTGFFVDVLAGGTPNGYAGLAGEAAGAYAVDAGPRQLLVGLLDGAGLVRLSIGARPVAGVGFELSGGYTLLAALPTLPRATLEAATGQPFSPAGERIALTLVVHALHVELGYSLVLFDHLLLRAAIGGALALGADFRVGVPDAMRPPGGPVQAIEGDIASSIPGRAFVPTLRLEAGASF